LGPWLNNLANVYMDQGNRDRAEEMMREALASDRKVLPEPHPSIALRLSNLASMAAWDGRYEEALRLAREALADYEELYPGPHPDIPYALVTIGNAQRHLGNQAAADSAHRAALEMRESLFPPGHIGLITANRYYAEHLVASKRYAEALPYLEKWRDLAAEIHGEEHYSFGLAVWTLGVAEENLERPDHAEPLLRRGFAIHETVLGETHPRVQDEREHLAAFLREIGKTEDALVLESSAPTSPE